MPIYLCNPGEGESEPWRYGIQVYTAPFNIDSSDAKSFSVLGTARDLVIAHDRVHDQNEFTTDAQLQEEEKASNLTVVETEDFDVSGQQDLREQENPDNSDANSNEVVTRVSAASNPSPTRRVRHAEVVLVDDVCISYSRYWLRLRWPGHKGGFAGYIAMGRVPESVSSDLRIRLSAVDFSRIRSLSGSTEDRGIADEMDQDDPTRDDIMLSTPPSEPFDASECLCARTGLPFQKSSTLKLLPMYDDGIIPRVTIAPFPTEQIFCRICREGLHEDADTDQPKAATEDAENAIHESREKIIHEVEEDEEGEGEDPEPIRTSDPNHTGPVLPHPSYSSNPEALRNPMLAPCECSGSMAFVHYLCVEQWRCRSRHPDARNGLNCETCGKPYALPPPTDRPSSDNQSNEHEDWLDAMPLHVMQALRQPHIWWQLGAAIVRRRWLRPLAPVIMSPIVALYCRARRLLKKRGVARRRWACSLCRRRARWKCVRCLRSYYCSRQCQNVSWHIIHKHVCYKPVRFWLSADFYGIIGLLLFPGILRDPFMYMLGLFFIPVSFIIMGVLGGGLATVIKRVTKVDVRGRLLELAAVICTTWLCFVTWGLVKSFFGNSGSCYGTFGTYTLTSETIFTSFSILRPIRWAILKPAEWVYLMLDRMILKFYWLRVIFCTKSETNVGCFEHLPAANANFFLHSAGREDGAKCASDLTAVVTLYLCAAWAFAGSSLLKHHERQRRRQQRGRPIVGRVFEVRPHQD